MAFKEEQENFRDYSYSSFIGWRSGKKKGKMINIDADGNRITHNGKASAATSYGFYGGSAMWGFGVGDLNTIPSQFSAMDDDIDSYNYGEQAYNARQNLNYFLNNIAYGRVEDVIIFYDGVNDVLHGCRSANGRFSDARTGFVRSILSQVDESGVVRDSKKSLGVMDYLGVILPNTIEFVRQYRGVESIRHYRLDVAGEYTNMCEDAPYAETLVADLIKTWDSARVVAEANGSKFYAILQPNPYTSDVEQPYSYEEFERMIGMVYPIIIEKASGYSWFIDGSGWLDGHSDVYIDSCCHVNEQGNRILVEKMYALLERN